MVKLDLCFYKHFISLFEDTVPADTRRKNNVIMTSQRRFDVMMTLLLRHEPIGVRM